MYHGWFVSSFAASRNPATPHLYYVVDNGRHVVQLDARDSRAVSNASFWAVDHRLGNIATDSSGHVFVVANSTADGYHLKVLDEQLRSLANISLDALQPPARWKLPPYSLQLVVDSGNAVYLFDAEPRGPTANRV